MTTTQLRVSRGIPAGGQFAADVHTEPGISLAAPALPSAPAGSPVENLRRSLVEAPELTADQAAGLRRHRTPIRNAMNRLGIRSLGSNMASADDVDTKIRALQNRLNRNF